jgi:hypothetical protein
LHGRDTLDGTLRLDEPTPGDPKRPIVIGSYPEGRATIRAGAGDGVIVRNMAGVEGPAISSGTTGAPPTAWPAT